MKIFILSALITICGTCLFAQQAEFDRLYSTYKGEEGMVAQFIPGMPAITQREGHTFIDTGAGSFESDILAFFEEYMAVIENQDPLETSRFALTSETALGFFELIKRKNRGVKI